MKISQLAGQEIVEIDKSGSNFILVTNSGFRLRVATSALIDDNLGSALTDDWTTDANRGD